MKLSHDCSRCLLHLNADTCLGLHQWAEFRSPFDLRLFLRLKYLRRLKRNHYCLEHSRVVFRQFDSDLLMKIAEIFNKLNYIVKC